ncbi:MAG: hypothetical protein F2873_04055 [Actinobacteria bacterium]|nr:hypothetical protein [Actinomycetota bacterium]
MKRMIGLTRYIVLAAVVGFAALSIATFIWGGAKTVLLFSDLLDGAWRKDFSLVKLLQVIDTYLLAIVQLIVALGLYELFIGDLDLPEWLHIRSLDDLKKSVIDVLVIFVAIKGVEVLFDSGSSADRLRSVGAVALLIASLTLFRFVKTASAKQRPIN